MPKQAYESNQAIERCNELADHIAVNREQVCFGEIQTNDEDELIFNYKLNGKAQSKIFSGDRQESLESLKDYLLEIDTVDSWEITDKDFPTVCPKRYYKVVRYSAPDEATVTECSSKIRLDAKRSSYHSGAWEEIDVSQPKVSQTPKFRLDNSGWFRSEYNTFDSPIAFAKAWEAKEASNESSKYLVGGVLTALTLTGGLIESIRNIQTTNKVNKLP